MYIRDIMSTNVTTVPSNTPMDQARKIMQAHRIRRLPVVDKGKLVGLVTERGLDRVSPSRATSLSIWELSYILSKMTVAEIMSKNVLTTTPDATLEEALSQAQARKVGCILAVEGGKLVGIVTTNDFFYRIVNPLLGIGMPGSRIMVHKCTDGPSLAKAIDCINRLGISIISMFTIPPLDEQKGHAMFHLGTEDTVTLISELAKCGFPAEPRSR